jgi:hypothetical protein
MAGDKKNTMVRPHSYFIATRLDGTKEELDGAQCCHCMAHFAVKPGSGKRRGFCMLCNQVTCGRSMCDPCVPKMQQVENLEAGRDRFFRPVQASLAGLDVPKAHLKGGILLGGK